MLSEQALPFYLSLTASVIATGVWMLTPRLRVSVHKEQPNRGFWLYEVCLLMEAGGRRVPRRLQISFYVSVKKS